MDIFEMRDRVQTLQTLENRMTLMREKIREAEEEVSELLRRYEWESRDAERIQKESLSNFLLKVIGKYDERVDKELREELDAKLAYDRAVTHLNTLAREKDDLTERISALRKEKRAYQAELESRRSDLAKRLSEPEGARYAELEKERNKIISQITEIKEALGAAYRAAATAEEALEALDSARGWATYDAFTRGGIISHMAKYSHIDDAEKCFHSLASQLRKLRRELADVHGLTVSGLTEISYSQRAVDFWFDNIFTDLSVRGKIIDNAEQVESLLKNINTAETRLNARLTEEEAKLADNRRREEELLISLR